jgi:hypothetical protein
MQKVYIVTKVEIRPLPESILYEQNEKISGAIVDVIVLAENRSDAESKAKQALHEDHYKIDKIEAIYEFNEVEWADEELKTQYKAMAWDALMTNQIGYGTFYTWINECEC